MSESSDTALRGFGRRVSRSPWFWLFVGLGIGLVHAAPILVATHRARRDAASPSAVLLVGSASRCGSTPNEGLVALAARHRDQGLAVRRVPPSEVADRETAEPCLRLFDRSGRLVATFGPGVAPDDAALVREIEALLARSE